MRLDVQKAAFQPVTITLETEEEVAKLVLILENYMVVGSRHERMLFATLLRDSIISRNKG